MKSTVTLPKTNNYPYIRNWDLNKIWELSKDFEVKEIKVNELWDERYSKVFCWLDKDEELTNLFFLHHLKRVLNADLDYPIILSEERYILDGVHRLMKAKHLGIKTIKYVQFKKDPLSKELY